MKYPFTHYFEYYFMLILQQTIRYLPMWLIILGTQALVRLVTIFAKPRNSLVLENLGQAFPEKSQKEREKIRDAMYFNILLSMLESNKYMYLSPAQKLKNLLIDDRSKAVINNLLHQGKGAIIVGGHYGFFEAAGHYSVLIDVPSAFVVANQKNKLTEELIDLPRRKIGLKVIHRKHARGLIEAIREKYFIALLTDQDAGSIGVFVDFFGKAASTHKNPAVLALKYDLPLMFTSTVRDEKRPICHHIHFEEIDYSDIKNSGLDHDSQVLQIVQRYTAILEKNIRLAPQHYWWIHKRYKTQPK